MFFETFVFLWLTSHGSTLLVVVELINPLPSDVHYSGHCKNNCKRLTKRETQKLLEYFCSALHGLSIGEKFPLFQYTHSEIRGL